MKGREILEFPILYSHAIDMATVRLLAKETIPMVFRIQIPIMVLKDGKKNQLVVISDWLSCETLMRKIIKARQVPQK